jgi:hypothetical protein
MLVRNKELHPCAINNHWTWYDVQISSIALFLNRTDIGKGILQTNLDKLISIQIKPDNRQPFELKRTNSWDYSLFNLQGLFKPGVSSINAPCDSKYANMAILLTTKTI